MAVPRARVSSSGMDKGRRAAGLPVRSWLIAGAAGAGIGAALMVAPAVASADDTGSQSSSPGTASASAGKKAATARSARVTAPASGDDVSQVPRSSAAHRMAVNLVPLPPQLPQSAAATVDGAAVAPKPKGATATPNSSAASSAAAVAVTKAPVVAKVAVGANAGGLVTSPDGKTVYVLNDGSGSVSAINVADNTKIKDIVLPDALDATAITVGDDGRIYVLSETQKPAMFQFWVPNPRVYAIDPATNKIVKTIQVEGMGSGFLKPIPRKPNSLAVGSETLYVNALVGTAPSYTPLTGKASWKTFTVDTDLANNALNCSTPRCKYYGNEESTWSTIQRQIPTASQLLVAGAEALASRFIPDKLTKYVNLDVSGLNTSPVDVAIAPASGAGYLYSVNSANDFVYVFDPELKVMVDAVFLGKMDLQNDTLKVSLNTVPTKIKFGPGEEAIAYVLNSASRELVRLDVDPARITTGRGIEVIDRLELSSSAWEAPFDMAISADGKYGYVISKKAVVEDGALRRTPVPPTAVLTVVNLADNTIVSRSELALDRSTELSGITVAGTKAFISTQKDSRLGRWAASRFPGLNKSQVYVVDLTKLTTG